MKKPAIARNLKLFPFIYILDRCWFWLPVWLFFYLLFTDYTGVAILDATMLLIFFLTEIPSGIFADRLGKKTTLVIAWLLMGVATIVMGYSPNFTVLFLTQIFVGLGRAFRSGTQEAIVYDTLKQLHQEKRYRSYLGFLQTLGIIALAITSILGGYLYTLDPKLPFVLNGLAGLIAAFLSYFLIEPQTDTVIVSFAKYWRNFKTSLKEFFQPHPWRWQLLALLTYAIIYQFYYEQFDTILIANANFPPATLGWLFAGMNLLVAVAMFFYSYSEKRYRFSQLFNFLLIIATFGSLFFFPQFGSLIVLAAFFLRNLAFALGENLTSSFINHKVASVHRSATLSTFSLIINLPYVLLSPLLGLLIDHHSPWLAGIVLGGVMAVFVMGYLWKIDIKKNRELL